MLWENSIKPASLAGFNEDFFYIVNDIHLDPSVSSVGLFKMFSPFFLPVTN